MFRGRGDVGHNIVALGLDYSCYLVAMSFASQATILPAFATHLGASSVQIGAIPAVMMVGWFLPSLFLAHHTERLPRKLPFVLRWTVWERLPLPALAAVAFFLADPWPGLALGALFALLLVMASTGGALLPAWLDIVARTVPPTLRGRFFGGANVLASAGGLLGSVLTAWILARHAPPGSYGLCFLAGSVFMVFSYAALMTVREPEGEARPAGEGLGPYLLRMPDLLRRDTNLSWFIVARAIGTMGGMAGGFYTVHALRTFEAAEWQVGLLTTAFLTGQLAGNAGLGWLADRAGHRVVLALGLSALAAASIVALAATTAEAMGLALALSGVYQASVHISARTILLELAPPAERPTYVGLSNTALAPVNFVAPLAAGLMVDGAGFRPVFALAAALAVAAVLVLLARVREPRRAGAPAA